MNNRTCRPGLVNFVLDCCIAAAIGVTGVDCQSTLLSAPADVAGIITSSEFLSEKCHFTVRSDSKGQILDFSVDGHAAPVPVELTSARGQLTSASLCRALNPGLHVSVRYAVKTLRQEAPKGNAAELLTTTLVLQSLRLDLVQP